MGTQKINYPEQINGTIPIGGSGLGFVGWDEGLFVATGTVLNVTGSRLLLSASGTVFNLNASPDPQELIGIYGLFNGVPLGTGTWIDFGNNLTVSISGTVIRLDASAGGSTTGTFTVQDEGITQGNVSTINFVGANVQATVAGTIATVSVTGSSGGGLAQSYLGYNTIGGSTENLTQKKWYAKKITPSNNGLLLSVGVYIKWQADWVWPISVAVYDNSGTTPNQLIAYNVMGALSGLQGIDLNRSTQTPRWVDFPISCYLTANVDYWIGFMAVQDTGVGAQTQPLLYYDSGADRVWTKTNSVATDPGIETQSDSTHKYSMRANFLS